MELPPLNKEEIDKYDTLLLYLKENNKGFCDILNFCNNKWGQNRQLYLSFATHLKINKLTIVQKPNGVELITLQMISQEGIAFDSFKNEYERQNTKAKKDASDESWSRFSNRFEALSKPVMLFIAIAAFVFGFYQYDTARKSDQARDKSLLTIDSLNKVVNYLVEVSNTSKTLDTLSNKKTK